MLYLIKNPHTNILFIIAFFLFYLSAFINSGIAVITKEILALHNAMMEEPYSTGYCTDFPYLCKEYVDFVGSADWDDLGDIVINTGFSPLAFFKNQTSPPYHTADTIFTLDSALSENIIDKMAQMVLWYGPGGYVGGGDGGLADPFDIYLYRFMLVGYFLSLFLWFFVPLEPYITPCIMVGYRIIGNLSTLMKQTNRLYKGIFDPKITVSKEPPVTNALSIIPKSNIYNEKPIVCSYLPALNYSYTWQNNYVHPSTAKWKIMLEEEAEEIRIQQELEGPLDPDQLYFDGSSDSDYPITRPRHRRPKMNMAALRAKGWTKDAPFDFSMLEAEDQDGCFGDGKPDDKASEDGSDCVELEGWASYYMPSSSEDGKPDDKASEDGSEDGSDYVELEGWASYYMPSSSEDEESDYGEPGDEQFEDKESEDGDLDGYFGDGESDDWHSEDGESEDEGFED